MNHLSREQQAVCGVLPASPHCSICRTPMKRNCAYCENCSKKRKQLAERMPDLASAVSIDDLISRYWVGAERVRVISIARFAEMWSTTPDIVIKACAQHGLKLLDRVQNRDVPYYVSVPAIAALDEIFTAVAQQQ